MNDSYGVPKKESYMVRPYLRNYLNDLMHCDIFIERNEGIPQKNTISPAEWNHFDFVSIYLSLGFGEKFEVGIDQVSGGIMIGSSILRNSDRKFLDNYSRCSLRLFSCKTTKATANIYFQRFEVSMNKRKPFFSLFNHFQHWMVDPL